MKRASQRDSFRTPSGHISYNKICLRCKHPCKQSYRVTLLACPYFERKR